MDFRLLSWTKPTLLLPGAQSSSHHHRYFEIAIQRSGSCRWFNGSQKPTILRPGQILILSPGQQHFEIPHEQPSEVAWCGFEIRGHQTLQPPVALPVTPSQNTRHFLRHLLDEMEGPGDRNTSTMIEASLVQFLVGLERERACTLARVHDKGAHSPIDQAARVLRSSSQKTLNEIAKEVGVSISSLRSRFIESYGMSPQHYREAQRTRRAIDLLQDGFSVSDVATRCGFQDANYFSRWFRKRTGETASCFRKNLCRH